MSEPPPGYDPYRPPGYGAYPPPGYGAYPPPGYPYPPPGYAVPVSPLSPSDERLWALFGHLSSFVMPVFGPLIIMLVQGPKSPFVRRHAVESLNFDITMMLALLVSIAAICLFFPILLLFIYAIAGMVFTILGAVRASDGQDYRYPLSLRMVS